MFGFRVSRRLTKHIEAEFNMDWDWGTAALSSATLAALQASQASFAPVWRQVLSDANPLSNFSVVDHRGQQIFTTGVAKIDLTTGRIRPFLTAGAGAVTEYLEATFPPSSRATTNRRFSDRTVSSTMSL